MVYIIGIIVLIVCIMIVFLFFKNSKLKDISESLDISITKIEKLLEEKFIVINELLEYVDDKKMKSKFKYENNDTLINREDILFEFSFDVNNYFKNEKIIKKNENNITSRLHKLNTLEEELDGLKDFYNANVLDYNEIFLKKYLNKIFRYLKFEEYKPFKIKKLEEYEIFKN